jgi:hypothetical protein
MEGGFEAERGTARPEPGFEPPVEPGGGPSPHALSLVARIMRGRELAGDAAGIPPLEPDQVLDLQRTAGNMLTAGALSRWTDLGHAGLLQRMLAARGSDPALHAALCSALDALELQLQVRVSCTEGPAARVAIEIDGPAGSASLGTVALEPGISASGELALAGAFGPAAAIAADQVLTVRLAASDGSTATAELTLPFAAPATIPLGRSRYEALATVL